MTLIDPTWQARVDSLWERLDEYSPDEFVTAMHEVTSQPATGVTDAAVAFERAGSFDSVGQTDHAVPLYRAALAAGADPGAGSTAEPGADPSSGRLDPWRRRQATIQLASSLRALGQAEEAVTLLEAEAEHPLLGDDDDTRAAAGLQDAMVAFLALALADAGREREAVGLAVGALAGHLTRYRRSLTGYAAELGPTNR